MKLTSHRWDLARTIDGKRELPLWKCHRCGAVIDSLRRPGSRCGHVTFTTKHGRTLLTAMEDDCDRGVLEGVHDV